MSISATLKKFFLKDSHVLISWLFSELFWALRMGLDMQPELLWNGLVQRAFMCFNGLVKVLSIINFRICDKTWKLMFTHTHTHTPSDLNELELFWKE